MYILNNLDKVKRYLFIIIPILTAIFFYLYIYTNTYGYIQIDSDKKDIYVSINYPNNYILYNNDLIKVPTGKNSIFVKTNDPKYLPYITQVNIEYKKTTIIKPRFYVHPNLTKINNLHKPIFLYDDQKTNNYDDNQLKYITQKTPLNINTDDLIGKIEYIHMINDNEVLILTDSISNKILYKFDMSTNVFTTITGNINSIAFFEDKFVFSIYNNQKYELYFSDWNNTEFKQIGEYDIMPIFAINMNKLMLTFFINNKAQSKLTIVDLNTFDIIEKQNITNLSINSIKPVYNGFLLKGFQSGKNTIYYVSLDFQDIDILNYNSTLALTDYYNGKFYFVDLNKNKTTFFIKTKKIEYPDIWAELKENNIFFKELYINIKDNKMYLYSTNDDVYTVNIE